MTLVILLLIQQNKTLGTLEPRNPGNLELWNLETLETCNLAILETCNCGSQGSAKPLNLARKK